jgi:hypothetical protein
MNPDQMTKLLAPISLRGAKSPLTSSVRRWIRLSFCTPFSVFSASLSHSGPLNLTKLDTYLTPPTITRHQRSSPSFSSSFFSFSSLELHPRQRSSCSSSRERQQQSEAAMGSPTSIFFLRTLATSGSRSHFLCACYRTMAGY